MNIHKDKNTDASGIILAGGRSTRMGSDKTLLLFNHETLMERTVNELRGVVDEIIIASNHTEKYNIPGTVEVLDTYTGVGPLGGIHAGLIAAKHKYAFIISGDLPLFNGQLATVLLKNRADYDAVVPVIKGRLEPLCAVYSQSCIEPIANCLEANIKKVVQVYSQIRILTIDEDELDIAGEAEKMFYNLNTPQDLQRLLSTHKEVLA